MKRKPFILVTGAAGFIGFNLSMSLLKDKKQIIGIDNVNDYYSVQLKKNRINQLKKFKNFKFHKVDLANYKALNNIFTKYKIEKIIHLAAQAGVRYSIIQPKKYLKSNFVGFFNIIELSRLKNIKKIIYASSSSVYGNSKKFPLKENHTINPNNFYGLSKKNNEETASIFSKYYDIKFIGIRFFTVYGEWGRPDMSIYKFIDASFKNKIFFLNNYGNHQRDFTYIKDVVAILKKIKFKKNIKNEIYNICSNKPIQLTKIFSILSKHMKMPLIKKRKLQQADVIKTHGDNKKVINETNFNRFTSFEKGLLNTLNWYKQYNKIKLPQKP